MLVRVFRTSYPRNISEIKFIPFFDFNIDFYDDDTLLTPTEPTFSSYGYNFNLPINISGVIFQLSFASILHLLAIISGISEFETASKLCLMAVGWNLIPFLRTDSYWLLCDLLKLDSLWKLPENATVSIRWFVYSYRFGKTAFLAIVLTSIIWQIIQFLR